MDYLHFNQCSTQYMRRVYSDLCWYNKYAAEQCEETLEYTCVYCDACPCQSFSQVAIRDKDKEEDKHQSQV